MANHQNQSKICSNCKKELPLSEFHFRNKEKGILKGTCKAHNISYHKKRYILNKEAIDHYQKNYRKLLREKILFAYGNKCSCCGETEQDFLTLEHKNKDGAKHRKEIGSHIYRDVVKQGYPDIFTLLCYNCNCSQNWNRVCPHKRNNGIIDITPDRDSNT